MQLVIPGLVDLPRCQVGGVITYRLSPRAELHVHALVPLPVDRASWGMDVVLTDTLTGSVKVAQVFQKHTELGWPATIAASELVDPSTAAVLELRLHVLYEFLDVGGVVVIRATDLAEFTAACDFMQPLFVHAQPDFGAGEVPALALVWAGL